MSDPISAELSVFLGDFRFILLGEMRRLLAEAQQAAERAVTPDFVSRERAELVVRRTLRDVISDLSKYGARIASAYPALGPVVAGVDDLAVRTEAAVDETGLIAIATDLGPLFGLPAHPAGARPVHLLPGDGVVVVRVGEASAFDMAQPTDPAAREVENARDAQLYLAAISSMIDAARSSARGLSGAEQIARAVGYQALASGHSLPAAFQPIATSGFRRWQTSLSLADPGEGHNLVTCLDARLLAGTVVHVEHIDRGKQTDREIVEAYRLPAPLSAARVRLQAGTAAPCTAYVGRPSFENGAAPDAATYIQMARYYDDDLLKAAHMTASACSVMFSNGIADCKIAIERMSARQAVQFMRAISANVTRDRSRQFLSAAFNINLPILNDRGPDEPHWVGDRIEVAHLGIDLAMAGGFDKVTWDGASNQPKSEPIIIAFSHAQWLGLIHSAHEKGLETYVSAGMDKSHMAACVETGVDGVGIGTSLHYLQRSPDGKVIMGELNPVAVLEVLTVRDAAAAGPKGRGAEALAMLDRLAFETLLPPTIESIRQTLFADLSAPAVDESAIEALLRELADKPFWQAMQRHKADSYDKHPAIAQAERRLLAAEIGEPRSFFERAATRSDQRLRAALVRGDITDLMEAMR